MQQLGRRLFEARPPLSALQQRTLHTSGVRCGARGLGRKAMAAHTGQQQAMARAPFSRPRLTVPSAGRPVDAVVPLPWRSMPWPPLLAPRWWAAAWARVVAKARNITQRWAIKKHEPAFKAADAMRELPPLFRTLFAAFGSQPMSESSGVNPLLLEGVCTAECLAALQQRYGSVSMPQQRKERNRARHAARRHRQALLEGNADDMPLHLTGLRLQLETLRLADLSARGQPVFVQLMVRAQCTKQPLGEGDAVHDEGVFMVERNLKAKQPEWKIAMQMS